ncbi:hypothetical protein LXL04_016784 [Taraxacum kok-saghyz]
MITSSAGVMYRVIVSHGAKVRVSILAGCNMEGFSPERQPDKRSVTCLCPLLGKRCRRGCFQDSNLGPSGQGLELVELLILESYKNVDGLLPYPDEIDIVPNAIAREMMKTGKPMWVRGSLTLPTQETSFTITGCANCLEPIETDITV